MSDMPTTDEDSPSRKPRLSFQVEPEDREALDALLPLIPGVKNMSESDVLRAVFRLGLRAVAAEPRSVMTVDTPTPVELTSSVKKVLSEMGRKPKSGKP